MCFWEEGDGWVGSGRWAAGIIARTPSVPLNNGQGEEINCLSKYQTCSWSELNNISWRATEAVLWETLFFNHRSSYLGKDKLSSS